VSVGFAGAANVAKAWLLVALITGFFAGIGWLLADLRGATLFAFASLLGATAVYWAGDRALLGMLGARPFALAEDPLLRSRTDRLAAATGVQPPKLYLIDDGFPRAFAVGRGPRSSSLAVSTGLLAALAPDELDVVLAHEVAHVRMRDVLTQTFAVLFGVTLVEASRVGGFLSRALLFVFAPIAAAFTHLLLSPKRELRADDVAARVTDRPHDLADALTRLDAAAGLVSFRASPATEPLYAVNPFDTEDKLARMFQTHPPLDERVARLRAMEAEQAQSRSLGKRE
jgi:heat shock protein HtpX